jgi:hypothetical protein
MFAETEQDHNTTKKDKDGKLQINLKNFGYELVRTGD